MQTSGTTHRSDKIQESVRHMSDYELQDMLKVKRQFAAALEDHVQFNMQVMAELEREIDKRGLNG